MSSSNLIFDAIRVMAAVIKQIRARNKNLLLLKNLNIDKTTFPINYRLTSVFLLVNSRIIKETIKTATAKTAAKTQLPIIY